MIKGSGIGVSGVTKAYNKVSLYLISRYNNSNEAIWRIFFISDPRQTPNSCIFGRVFKNLKNSAFEFRDGKRLSVTVTVNNIDKLLRALSRWCFRSNFIVCWNSKLLHIERITEIIFASKTRKNSCRNSGQICFRCCLSKQRRMFLSLIVFAECLSFDAIFKTENRYVAPAYNLPWSISNLKLT